jgi:chemotaxis protein methyltransferase CheR
MEAAWSEPVFERLAQLVAARTGIVVQRTPEDFERGTRRVMERLAIEQLDDFTNRLAMGTGWDALIDEITVGETYFFRNPEQFELVRNTILPALARERSAGHVLKLWSAGCASGEEAYSLAILLHECGLLETARVYGSDISALAVAKARAASYREWSFRAVGPTFRGLYFSGELAERTVADSLREQVSFRQLNLATDDYRASSGDICAMDLIFCRNVLIYFDAATNAHVERKLFDALAPGGWLVTGPSDPPLGEQAPFERVSNEGVICYRRPDAISMYSPVSVDVVSCALAPVRAVESIGANVRAARPPARVRPVSDQHALASAAFARADYRHAIAIARMHPNDHALSVLGVRASWNYRDAALAQRACAEAIVHHGLSTELHYLNAVALMDCRRLPEAVSAVQKAIYLDRTLSVAHFTLGSILERMQDLHGARRAYRNAYEASLAQHPDEPLELADGIVASGMAAAAAGALAALQGRRVG